MNKVFYITFLVFISLLTSCNQDKDVFIPNALFPEGVVLTTITGQISDGMNQPLADAQVRLDLEETTTDENGFFVFGNVEVDAQRAVLEVSKVGYFDGGRAIIPAKEGTSALKIQLLERTIVGNFSGSTGGTINLNEDLILEMPEDVVLNSNGAGHTGEVQVAANVLNPENLIGLQKMPTDLKGITAGGNEKLLESFGIFNFEWSDANQQKLSIVPGKKIKIRFSVPNGLVNNAPATIGLWHFDEAISTWKEEGTAILENGKYVAEIGQSGFWNCAIPHDFISVKGILKNENNQALTNVSFSVEVIDGGVMGMNQADASGNMVANLPKDIPARIKVLEECNDTDYSTIIGALSEDALVSNLKISNSSEFSKFRATLLDCENNFIQNGYIILSVDTKTYFFPIASDGTFQADLSACDISLATMVAYDVDNQKESEILQVEIFANTEVGEVTVCF